MSKHTDPIAKNVEIGDQKNMCFSGTTVVRGRGKAIVTSTGMSTEIGKIASLVSETEDTKTPLQIRIKKLGEKLALGAIIISIIVFVAGIYRGLNFF